jgi:hypothetical protein
LTNKNGNGHGKYQPKVTYQYLDADVWIKKDEATGLETVAYTEDILAELYGEDDLENSNPDKGN